MTVQTKGISASGGLNLGIRSVLYQSHISVRFGPGAFDILDNAGIRIAAAPTLIDTGIDAGFCSTGADALMTRRGDTGRSDIGSSSWLGVPVRPAVRAHRARWLQRIGAQLPAGPEGKYSRCGRPRPTVYMPDQ